MPRGPMDTPFLLDGTNASDDEAARPVMRALRELEVHSPCGSAESRRRSIRGAVQKAGLFTWNQTGLRLPCYLGYPQALR
jgi:PP-loop superfamily ATP-utilizing enzyme